MLKKIKHALGIESVKIEIELEDSVSSTDGGLNLKIIYSSQNDATITGIAIKCIEKYFRGRRKSKLINEYTIGELEVSDSFEIKADEEIVKDYTIDVESLKSPMDEMADSNFVFKGMVGVAKFFKGVKSEYRIEAEAKVKGMKLNPIAKKEFTFSK